MDAETLTVFGSDHRFRAQFTIPDAGGTFKSLQYKGFDAERNADVTAFDFEFDGRLDARRIYFRDDDTSTTQHRIGSEWHDLGRTQFSWTQNKMSKEVGKWLEQRR